MAEYIIDEQAYCKALHAAFSAGAKGHAGYATDCLTDELVRCKDCRSARIACGQDVPRETPGGCGEGLSWTVVPGDGGDVVRIEVDGEVVGCIPVEDIANAASTA